MIKYILNQIFRNFPTIPVPQANIINTNIIRYIKEMKFNCEEWWRESQPHLASYPFLLLV